MTSRRSPALTPQPCAPRSGAVPGFSDIQLADGSSGLDAVNEILGSEETPVIFITGYPQLFLTGQAPEPAFLITKPFTADSVKAVISQALFFDRKSHVTTAKAETG